VPAAEGAATALVAPAKVPANSGANDASRAPPHHRRRSNVKEAGVEVPAGARRRSDQAGLTAQTAASEARRRLWPHHRSCGGLGRGKEAGRTVQDARKQRCH